MAKITCFVCCENIVLMIEINSWFTEYFQLNPFQELAYCSNDYTNEELRGCEFNNPGRSRPDFWNQPFHGAFQCM